jgi:hypothetical protein
MTIKGSRFEGHEGAQGIELILRHENGESLSPQEYQAMRAAMYLLNQYANPSREWDEFVWQGPEHFLREVWPKMKDRSDIMHGYFGHGEKSP